MIGPRHRLVPISTLALDPVMSSFVKDRVTHYSVDTLTSLARVYTPVIDEDGFVIGNTIGVIAMQLLGYEEMIVEQR